MHTQVILKKGRGLDQKWHFCAFGKKKRSKMYFFSFLFLLCCWNHRIDFSLSYQTECVYLDQIRLVF
jgi:hypothetical protein